MRTREAADGLRTTLASLTQEDARTWARIGYALDQVDVTGFWQGKAASFSEWLRTFAPSLGLREASLWRYLTAARYYQKLRLMLSERGVACPPLESLPANVSPENLELLAKLARVAPDDVLRTIATRVVSGSIKRAELRTTWQIYRPALGGRTARGTRGVAPTVDPTDPEQFDSLIEAQIVTVLMTTEPTWTGSKQPYLYTTMLRVSPEFGDDVHRKYVFDAVVITRAKRNSRTDFHGIEIRGENLYGPIHEVFEAQRPFCNYLWLAAPESASASWQVNIPEYVGLLEAHRQGVRILRKARRLDGELSGDLAKGLLLKALRH